MLQHQHELGTIFVPDAEDDLYGLVELANRSKWWSADTESTGLNQYEKDFRVKLVQMGNAEEAWLLNPEYPRHRGMIEKLLENGPETYWINMIYDLISLEVSLGLDFDKLAIRAIDLGIDSRLIDPRGRDKGGSGHKMEDLARHYLGIHSKLDARKALSDAWGRGAKVKIEDVFREVPVELPEYQLYAGQDVFVTSRLAEKLIPIINGRPELRRLHDIEHPLAVRCAMMERIGMGFDHEWAGVAEEHFDGLRDEAEKQLAEKWGVRKKAAKWVHTSAKQLKEKFIEQGAVLEKRTKPSKTHPEGQISLDADVLKALSYEPGDVGEFARDVLTAKRSEHYGGYIRGMRAELGTDGRIHPKVHPLAAATARMSITHPPIQQFPRGDAYIRGCLLADDGDIVLTADYQAIEFRMAAAVSQDPVMTSRIINGEDLHAVTATALFGPEFNKDQRQASKPIAFGRLYLGGAKGIRDAMIKSDTTGYVPPLNDIQRAIRAFDRDYRVFARWGKDLIKAVGHRDGRLTTITGRPLIVDKNYAAVNYSIQSASRDVLAAGITALHRVGLGDRLRLVVHDEVILSVDPAEAEEVQHEVEKAMNTVVLGVPMVAEADIKGKRWAK